MREALLKNVFDMAKSKFITAYTNYDKTIRRTFELSTNMKCVEYI